MRVGTVDLPPRMTRERYFRERAFLELSMLFAGPARPSVLAKWADESPRGALGLVAPFPLTHRKPPGAPKLWAADATCGDFRDSAPGRAALTGLTDAVKQVGARCVVFRSPDDFSPSATNREQLRRFFSELATPELVGAERVWLPGGLWDVRTATKLATELGLTCAFDPLVREPGAPLEVHFDLEGAALYLRIEGASRAGTIRNERLEDLVELVEHYADRPITIAFASPERWLDARNFSKLLDA